MIVIICDNNYCYANLVTIVNVLLTVLVVFLVLKQLEGSGCEQWKKEREAGDMGRECPCRERSSTPGTLVLHELDENSILPDWWQFKTWVLEKLPDIPRPLNPSQILSQRPSLKFIEKDTYDDRTALPSFDFGSCSQSRPLLPSEVKALQPQPAGIPKGLQLAKHSLPSPDQDQRGWVFTKSRGWVLALKKQGTFSNQKELKTESPLASSGFSMPLKPSPLVRTTDSAGSFAKNTVPPSKNIDHGPKTAESERIFGAEYFTVLKGAHRKHDILYSSSTPGLSNHSHLSAHNTNKVHGFWARRQFSSRTERIRKHSNRSVSDTSTPRSSSSNGSRKRQTTTRALDSLGPEPPPSCRNRSVYGKTVSGIDGPSPSGTRRIHDQESAFRSFSILDTTVEKQSPITSMPFSALPSPADTSMKQRENLASTPLFAHSIQTPPVDASESVSSAPKEAHRERCSIGVSFQTVQSERKHSTSNASCSSHPLNLVMKNERQYVLDSVLSSPSTPSTEVTFFSFSVSPASSTLSSPAFTAIHSPCVRSNPGSPTNSTKSSRNGSGNPISPFPSTLESASTIKDNDAITWDQSQQEVLLTAGLVSNVGNCMPSQSLSVASGKYLSHLPLSRSMQVSSFWSSKCPLFLQAWFQNHTVEALAVAPPPSPISLHLESPQTFQVPSLANPCPHSSGHSTVESQKNSIRLSSSCTEDAPLSSSESTSTSQPLGSDDLSSCWSAFTATSNFYHHQHVQKTSVDKQFFTSQSTYVVNGLSRSDKQQRLSTFSRVSKPLKKGPIQPSASQQPNKIDARIKEPRPRRKNVWEPGAWPDPKQPQDCKSSITLVTKESTPQTNQMGLSRSAAVPFGNLVAKIDAPQRSFLQKGKRLSELRRDQSSDPQAQSISMEYTTDFIANSYAQSSSTNNAQESTELTSSLGPDVVPQLLAQCSHHQNQSTTHSLPTNAHAFPETAPINYRRYPDTSPKRTVVLDYQGHPIPSFKPTISRPFVGTSAAYMDYQGYSATSCTDLQGYPDIYSPGYERYPFLSHPCSQEQTATPAMDPSGSPSACLRKEGLTGTSSINFQSYFVFPRSCQPAMNFQSCHVSPTSCQEHLATSSIKFHTNSTTCGLAIQEHPGASVSGTCDKHPMSLSSSSKLTCNQMCVTSSKVGNHTVSEVDNQPNEKRLAKEPFAAHDLRANLASLNDLLNNQMSHVLFNNQVDKEKLPTQTSQPASDPLALHLELKAPPGIYPIPGDVVILFSSLLPSPDRGPTFIYFHPNQSSSEPEPRKGNMAVIDEKHQRAMLLRYGELDRKGTWVPSIQVKLFYTGGNDIWNLVTKTFVTELPWLHWNKKPYTRLRMPDPRFKPRSGDLIVRTALPKSSTRGMEAVQHQTGDVGWALTWWKRDHRTTTNDVIVRTYVGPAPRRNNQPSYSLLGRVEMYAVKDEGYLFMGRDQHTFSLQSKAGKRSTQSSKLRARTFPH